MACLGRLPRLAMLLGAAAGSLLPCPAQATIDAQFVAGNLESLVDIQHAGDGSGRLFLVLQGGLVRIYDGTQVLATPFLDVSALTSLVGERGLLGLAFHPDYPSNGLLYVHYTDTAGDTVLARYRVSADPDIVDPGTASTLLTLAQPFGNHNGGQIRFGPDGFLYIALGDGGSGGDPLDHGQDRGTLFGSILRLDVDGGSPYAIPPDNPFIDTPGARGEIWAWGLRNPWRFSFDRATGDLFVADVGQDGWEEVNLQPAGTPGGLNLGWRLMEGTHCHNPTTGCNDGTLTLPVVEYAHALGCSVTGGFRYRGSTLSAQAGAYLFADFCTGRIWAAAPDAAGRWTATQIADLPFPVSAFGEDEDGELYLAQYGAPGALRRLVPAADTPALRVTRVGPGGSGVTTAPVALDCGSICGAHFPPGTVVSLDTVLEPGATFAGFLGDPDCADATVTLSGDRACTAVFGPGFTDDPLVAGTTVIRTAHVTELRARIDLVRLELALPVFDWTEPTLVAGTTPVRADHVLEMREALEEAYVAAGRVPPGYAHPALGTGTPIRVDDLMELRAGVLDLESS